MLVAILLHQKIDIKSSPMSSLGTGLTKLLPSSFLKSLDTCKNMCMSSKSSVKLNFKIVEIAHFPIETLQVSKFLALNVLIPIA
jgi:hypothetical protein